ncbi:MAG: carbon storage regulator CsrA [Gracilibacter sp. BRH_c7a]|nr:MAG: carbon storage regulator CsrA [Gracilibacter sp. BRH_c7a]
MLVLSRKVNETILIGDDIEIVVVAVAGDNVRLGIKAPKDVKILRSEVYEDIQKQNVEAASGSPLHNKDISAKLQQMLGDRLNNKE